MTVNEWLRSIVQGLVEFPEMVAIIEHPLNDTLYLQVCVASTDIGKVVGPQGSGWRALRDLVFIKGKQDGVRYFLESRIAPNQATDVHVAPTDRRSLPESDASEIVSEFLATHNLTPDAMSRADALNLIRWADGDASEVRAYMLAFFRDSMRDDAVAALRNG